MLDAHAQEFLRDGMSASWNSTTLTSKQDVLRMLTELHGRRWLSRGHSRQYGCLVPSIDRGELASVDRAKKLECERRSIDTFRSTARFFASSGEAKALEDDVVTLMVLRHYGVRTRLLDWSASPFVAAYFAASADEGEDGEIWTFSHDDYAREGKAQWRQWPETTLDGSGDDDTFAAGLTAFRVDEPPNWIIACFYPSGFPRQDAQRGCYTMTARFCIDHAVKLEELLKNGDRFRHLVIPASLKQELCAVLQEKHGIWRGSLFPESAGAAETAGMALKNSV